MHTPIKIEQAEDGSAEWLHERRRGIGGSDAGIVLGVNPFTDRLTLWRRKLGQEPGFVGNVHTDYGAQLEPYIFEALQDRADVFAEDAENDAIPWSKLEREPRAWQHPEHDFMRCNVDGNFSDDALILEVKTSTSEFRDLPDYHYSQVQHNIEVGGREACLGCVYVHFHAPFDKGCALEMSRKFVSPEARDDYWRWVVSKGDLTTIVVERDDAYIDRMVDKEREFWAHVENETEPGDIVPDGEIRADDDEKLNALVSQYVGAHRAIKQAEANATYKGKPLEVYTAEQEDVKSGAKDRIKQHMAAYRGDKTPKKVHVEDGYVGWNARGYWRIYGN